MNSHPLHRAIALLKNARKSKAHSRVIQRLEERVGEEAARVQTLFSKSEFGRKVLNCIATGQKLD